MNEYVTWQAAVLSVTCGVPLAFAFLVRGGRRRPLRCVFEAGATSVGLLVPWLNVAWHGSRWGSGPRILAYVEEIVLCLTVVSVLLHGGFAIWLGRRIESAMDSPSEDVLGRAPRESSLGDLARRGAVRAAGVAVVVVGLSCGWTISDGMGYPGGVFAMLFPVVAEHGLSFVQGVERGCVPLSPPSPSDWWCPLPASRFLVLAISLAVPFVAVNSVRHVVRRRRDTYRRGRAR